MTKILSFLYISFLLTPVITQAKTTCDLNSTFITLTKKNTDIEQIVKAIGEQADYDIHMKHTDFLKTKKTIYLNKTPLSTCFTRLFKEANYSVICDTAQKTLQIVILDNSGKKTGTMASAPPAINPDNTSTVPDTTTSPPQEFTESDTNWEFPPEPISRNTKVPKAKLSEESFSSINDL